MTANAMQGDRERCIEAGMDDYIAKPVRPEDMQAALKRSDSMELQRNVPGTGAQGPIDMGALVELEMLQQEGDPDVVAELLVAYLREAPLRVADLERAVAEGDASSIERMAHNLKASSATFGANRVAACCRQLEELGRNGQVDGLEAALAQLQEEMELARSALDEERLRRGGPPAGG